MSGIHAMDKLYHYLYWNLYQALTFEHHDNGVNDLWDSVVPQVDSKVGIGWRLVLRVDTWNVLDLSIPCPLVESSSVDLFTVFQRSSNVDQEVVSTWTGDGVLQLLSSRSQWGDGSGDNGGSGTGELGSDKCDSSKIEGLGLGRDGGVFVSGGGVGVVWVELITKEKRDGSATVLL